MKTIHFRLLRTTTAALVIALYLLPAVPQASAIIDATWGNFPEDNNWNNGDNWDTETAPNGQNDKATFTNSSITTIFLSESTSVAQITFQPGPSFGKEPVEVPQGGNSPTADAFTIHTNGSDLDFYGAGIINNSGKTQTIINDDGGGSDPTITFHNSSSAGSVTIVNASNFNEVHFVDSSSAGSALIINQAVGTSVVFGGAIRETDSVENSGNLAVEDGGSTAANSTIVNQGDQSHVTFVGNASGGSATIINVSPTSYVDISGITGSSLTLGAVGGGGTVYLGSKNLAVGGNNLSTVFSGVIADGSPELPGEFPAGSARPGGAGGVGGSLTKTGTGTLTLAGANTYTGNTFVNGGTLAITGSIVSPNVFVNTGGTLFVDGSIAGNAILNGGMIGGNGLIGGSLINNSGTVSPGHSPGTLRMNGNYTQGSAGTLIIQLASSTVFDKVIAGGSANLGGTLVINPLTGFKLKRNETFQVISTGGGVSGTFSNVIQPDTGTILKFGLVYESNAVLLDAQMGSFASLPGLTPNEQAVANELDRIANDDRSSKLINYLARQSLGALAGDFDKIAAEELTSVFTLGTSFDNVQILNLLRRNSDLRSGANGFSASGFHATGSAPSASGGFGFAGPSGDDGKESKEMKTVVPEENRWGFFITGVGDWVGVGGDYNSRGYDIQTGGFTLGVDYKIGDHFAVGLMAGYVGTGVDLNDGGRVFVDGGKLGVYATAFAGGFYTDFAVTGGYSSYDMHRSALQGTARSDTDGGDLNVLVGTGYDWKVGGFSFGPTATFNYTYVGISGFTESGSLAPLSFGAQGQESIRSSFGFKASYDLKFGGIMVKPEVSAAWQHEYGDTTYALDSSFASGAGNAFSVSGPQLGRDSALIGAGFAIQWNDRFSTYVYYDGELGRTNYNSQSVSGGFRFSLKSGST